MAQQGLNKMSKRISAVIDEYKKDGQDKAKWIDIGAILTNNNGKEYILLNPEVNLAGVLAKQNALEFAKGGQMRSNVMCSIVEDSNQNNQQQGGFSQQNPQQSGYNQR